MANERRLQGPLIVLGLAFVLSSAACMRQPTTIEASEEAAWNPEVEAMAIRALVDTYVQAADNADVVMAGDVWLQSNDVSLIYPGGYEAGWDAIRQDFYQETLGDYSVRKLTPGDIEVHVFGDTAVAEFSWVFDATQRVGGAVVHLAGRESQVYHWTTEDHWALVHVHYSFEPGTGD